MSKEDLNRYIVRDGYSYFTGDPANQQHVHVTGSILTLTNKQIEAHRQPHKLEACEDVVVRCNDCGKEFKTRVVQIQYAKCTHCGKRGGDLMGPAPRDANVGTPVLPQDAPPVAEQPKGTPENGTGDSAAPVSETPTKPAKVEAKPKKARRLLSRKAKAGK